MLELRPYQTEAITAIQASFQRFNKVLAVLPTGSGKTIIFANIAKHFVDAGHKVLILAHRDELITQATSKLLSATGLEAQIEKAESRASLDAPVVVASIQTLANDARLQRFPEDHFGLIIADEAHHCLSNSWQRVLSHFDTKTLGVTATPARGDKKKLGEYFEDIAYEVTLFELIREHYLSKITICSIPLAIDLSGARTIAGDFNEADLGQAIHPYLQQLAASIRDHAIGRRVLAFLPLIATSQAFVEACLAEGLSAAHIDGKSVDRAAILERFAHREYDVLSNASLLTEGYDDCGIDCIALFRPTRSQPLYAQMCGRGTRIAPDKSDLLLLDPMWQHETHSLACPASLVAKNDDEANRMTALATDGQHHDLFDLQLEVERDILAERQETLRRSLSQNRGRDKRLIDAEEFSLSLNDSELWDYQPTMAWHSEPATQKQLDALNRFGIDTATISCKGHASKILEKLMARSSSGLCTVKQLHWLRKVGHPSPEMTTFTDAKTILSEQFNSGERGSMRKWTRAS